MLRWSLIGMPPRAGRSSGFMHRWRSSRFSSRCCSEHGPVAENPFDLKNFGLLAALGAEPHHNSLLGYVTPPTPTEVSPMARAIADLLMDRPKPALPVSGAANDLFAPQKSASPPYSFGDLGAVADLFS